MNYEQMLIISEEPMPRPIKCRRVEFSPEVTYFKPAGIPLSVLDENIITVEEVEALRLKDLEGLEQEEGAERMNISRPTFQRILSSARKKITDAILNGKAMRIEGGNYELTPRRFQCANGHEWTLEVESLEDSTEQVCPVCHNTEVSQSSSAGKGCRRGKRDRCCRKDVQT